MKKIALDEQWSDSLDLYVIEFMIHGENYLPKRWDGKRGVCKPYCFGSIDTIKSIGFVSHKKNLNIRKISNSEIFEGSKGNILLCDKNNKELYYKVYNYSSFDELKKYIENADFSDIRRYENTPQGCLFFSYVILIRKMDVQIDTIVLKFNDRILKGKVYNIPDTHYIIKKKS